MSTLAQLVTACPSLEIHVDGYTLEADQRGYYGTIRFWFLNADLTAFTTTVGGVAQTFTTYGVSVTRLIPLQHPYIIGGNCYADSVRIYPPDGSVAGLDGTGHGIGFTDWFADVHFSTPTYPMTDSDGSNPTATLDLTGFSDMVTRPGSAYKLLSDGKPIAGDLGVPVMCFDFTITNHKLAAIGTATYLSVTGCVNSVIFFGQAIGTVLYEGPGVQGQFFVAGVPTWDAAHHFKYRSVPHNQIMRPDGAGFDTPIARTGGAMLIPSADLNVLMGV